MLLETGAIAKKCSQHSYGKERLVLEVVGIVFVILAPRFQGNCHNTSPKSIPGVKYLYSQGAETTSAMKLDLQGVCY